MSRMILIFLVGIFVTLIDADLCRRPEVQSKIVYIYRLRDTKNITIYNCFHIKSATISYSDITDRCIKALKSGVFVDKFNKSNSLVQHKSSKGYVVNYFAKADRIENKVYLKSGTVCPYDRGFCFDPKEHNSYAVVWDIDLTPNAFTGDLIYQGNADIWSFKNNTLKYLFHESRNKNEAFSFQLLKQGKIGNVAFWFTEKKFIVAEAPLGKLNLSRVNVGELAMGTKNEVSEAVLKSCDIQSLEFTQSVLPVSEEYFTDPNNLKTILLTFGHTLTNVSEELIRNFGKNEEAEKKIDNYIKNMQVILEQKDNTIDVLKANVSNLNSSLINYVTVFNKLQNKLNDLDPQGLENNLKSKMNTENVKLTNKLDKVIKDLPIQENINLNVSEKLKVLDNIVLELDLKNVKLMNLLSDLQSQANASNSQTQVSNSTPKALENLKNNVESELSKLSEKHSLMLKLIAENKQANSNLNRQLASLNESIYKDSNASINNYCMDLESNFEDKLTNIRNFIENFETKFPLKIQKQLQAENDKLAEKYNLISSRLYDAEKSSSHFKKQLEAVNETVNNVQKENRKCNNSMIHLESTILQKLDSFQTKHENDLKYWTETHDKIVNDINDINEKYKDLMKTKQLVATNISSNQDIKYLESSINEIRQAIATILNDIKDLEELKKSLSLNTVNIDILYSRLETEKQRVQFLNLNLERVLATSKIYTQKLLGIANTQTTIQNTVNSHENKLELIQARLNKAQQDTDRNTRTLILSKIQCNECALDKFKALEERLAELEGNLLIKDKTINEWQSEIKTLLKKQTEDIINLREDVNHLIEETMQVVISNEE